MKLNKTEVANRLRAVLDETEAYMQNALEKRYAERIAELESHVNDYEKHLAEQRERLAQLEAAAADNLVNSQEELATLKASGGKEKFFQSARKDAYACSNINALRRDINYIKETLNFLELVDGDTITVREADNILRNVMGVLKVRW